MCNSIQLPVVKSDSNLQNTTYPSAWDQNLLLSFTYRMAKKHALLKITIVLLYESLKVKKCITNYVLIIIYEQHITRTLHYINPKQKKRKRSMSTENIRLQNPQSHLDVINTHPIA